MEEIVEGNTQTITQLFDGRYSFTILSAADDVVHGGLPYTAIITTTSFDAVGIIR